MEIDRGESGHLSLPRKELFGIQYTGSWLVFVVIRVTFKEVDNKKGDYSTDEICDCVRADDACSQARNRASFLTIASPLVEETPSTVYSTLEYEDSCSFDVKTPSWGE